MMPANANEWSDFTFDVPDVSDGQMGKQQNVNNSTPNAVGRQPFMGSGQSQGQIQNHVGSPYAGFHSSSNSTFYNPNQYAAPMDYNYQQQQPQTSQMPYDATANQQLLYSYSSGNIPASSPFNAPVGSAVGGLSGASGAGTSPSFGGDKFDDEPPLLEELGINIEHILQKTLTVLNPMRATSAQVASDCGLAGPLSFGLAFGICLLLNGKVHFNYIYGFGLFGCLAMYVLLSLMAPIASDSRLDGKRSPSSSTQPDKQISVSFMVVMSTLGYCILPMVLLSLSAIFISLSASLAPILLTVACVLWSSTSASKLFVTAFHMESQQILVAYPCCLLYAVFALLTVF